VDFSDFEAPGVATLVVLGMILLILSAVKRTRGLGLRILVGGAVSAAVLALLYGPVPAVQLVGLLTVCTSGIGLIPMLFVSWIVGWVVLQAVAAGRAPQTPAPDS
jgi:hypothetical protein